MKEDMNIRKYYLIVCLLSSSYLILSCSFYSKDDYLENFMAFVSEVEANYKIYTSENWVEKDNEFQQYAERYYNQFKEELTNEDQRTIGKLKAKYQTLKIKNEAWKILDKIENGLNQLDGIFRE